MPVPTWPISLPEYPTRSFSEDSGKLILRSPMDAGPAKQRLRGNRPSNLNFNFEMDKTQVQTFSTFVHDTLLGVLRFTIKHPRTLANVEVRIVPQDNGKLFDLQFIQLDLWSVSFQAEVLP